jgi:hypothetical protein
MNPRRSPKCDAVLKRVNQIYFCGTSEFVSSACSLVCTPENIEGLKNAL